MLRYQVEFAAQEYEYSDDDFDLDDYWLGIRKFNWRVFFRMTLNFWGSHTTELAKTIAQSTLSWVDLAKTQEKFANKFPPTEFL